MTTPRAFDITPLTVNAPSGSMRGPRTPFSPERERTFVTPPEVNPERHAQLAGAMDERRGATEVVQAKEVANKLRSMLNCARDMLNYGRSQDDKLLCVCVDT